MHQAIGKLPAVGDQKQSAGVEIEPADGDPARAANSRQLFEHAGAAFGIIPRDNLPFRLVVQENAGHTCHVLEVDEAAIELDLVLAGDSLPDMGGGIVDAYPAFGDPGFNLASRAMACIGQSLLQLDRRQLDRIATAPRRGGGAAATPTRR